MPSVNYLWDPVEDNVIAEFDDAGNLLVDYTTEPDLYGNVISQHRDGETNVFYSDTLGSTVAVTNQADNVVATRAYSVFGETTESTGSLVFPYQFVGQMGYYFEVATGQHYIRRRTYRAAIGRWISIDPVSSLRAPHGYLYVQNSPLIRVDPTGLTDLLFDPSKSAGMEWFNDPKLKPPRYGTSRAKFVIQWRCIPCCNEPKKYYLEFLVDVIAWITLNKDTATALEKEGVKDVNGVEWTLKRLYGHEQRHIDNLRELFEAVRVLLDEDEARVGCVDAATCKSEGESVEEEARRRIRIIVKMDFDHLLPKPKDGVAYEPMGEMPKEPSTELRKFPEEK